MLFTAIFLIKCFPNNCLATKYVYLDVLEQNADCRDTISDVLSILHSMFNIGGVRKHLVVCGDAKIYLHLQAIKLDF